MEINSTTHGEEEIEKEKDFTHMQERARNYKFMSHTLRMPNDLLFCNFSAQIYSVNYMR